ncbi:hypothetical protein PCC8801_0181 [Rippkaea orientalis PCC 8801]|uniref:Circadian oscillating protein COP23 n=1 Tax=Rippkaea orientalis (strain PCC 8801 / RF-1) TaxID=41431 RepID=B7K1X8_RIPO1|nr:COP23 domain-containing protein [Rippkaea orientalis]ACK64285.1 hypothetical protein PCC8801_0181 [Rippkaea orientalis PCC 8801]
MTNFLTINRNSLIKGMGFSLAIAFMLTQSEAIAKPINFNFNLNYNPNQQYAQNTDNPGDIVVDTNPESVPPPPPVQTTSANPRFSCQLQAGRYTVMYYPQNQNRQPYPWAIPSDLGDGWTAQRRCNEISRRLEMYRPDGLLELQTGRENSYDTICVTTQRDSSCRIVLTVPPGKNPEITRNQIFQTLMAAEEGQLTQGVSAFSGGNSGGSILNQLGGMLRGNTSQPKKPSSASGAIDLRPFLDTTDGGTAAQLQSKPSTSNTPAKSTTPSNSWRLNPDRFR